jgi:TetR/AcrR family transcriptional regulator, lmrAB and yxaGH operons repressor
MISTNPTPGTRERLITAMLDALQRRGLHGVGLNELLTQANAPKGVLYHHFPKGKTELAVAAIDTAIAKLTLGLDQMTMAQADPVQVLQLWMASAQKQLAKSDFERGCPLATVALESGMQDTAIRKALKQGFLDIRTRLASMLTAAGLPESKASQLAALIVAAYEGALIQSRVAGSVLPMADVTASLIRLVQFELQSNANQITTGLNPPDLKP